MESKSLDLTEELSDTLPPRDEAMAAALRALQAIAKHEKECGQRWGEAHAEMKLIRQQLGIHSRRWERLAWLVIGTMTAGVVAVVVQSLKF